ncbi:cullin-associated NEDD8-dissociated 1 isoform B [Chlorella sorokiniana]|uniref:Cullin-associated NEDD8-dissociated 1 isoform B n=1 Tax=Chlorella sorokiniana TaxID=3076 RepID=A0A2P6TZ57_CHLSO|nr:cullin-associated NEDD8-dissociated 1 isoform B [Chlorella sorokiniana]|eukprot:PRW59351.1 cullin-associated NEDD8-dissociated 1 isoform B [Chlorella sorokiniana]
MATSDLANELAKESFRFDNPMAEKQVSDVVLNQLEDASGDISGLAVKCLGYLVNRNRPEQLEEVVAQLCDKLTGGSKEQLRDVASLGLKTVVAELSPKKAGTLVSTATPKLIEGLKSQQSDVVAASLDILAELTARYGSLLPDPEGLKKALLPELDESRAGVRKRAIQCLASLAAALQPASLDDLCDTVFTRLEGKGLKPDTARTYIQAVGGISKSVGYRFGKHLGRAVPLAIRYLRGAAEGDEELREYCLQALESFVQRSPQDARAQLGDILPTCLEFLRFDPNYADDDMDEEEEAEDMDAEDEEDASEEEWSDDEDVSWKVRRAAAKAVSAVITHFPDLLPEIYPQVAPVLVQRFREREETVKADVFQAYVDLLRQVGLAARRSDGAAPGLLRADIPAVIRAVSKQLRSKSAKTKVGVFRVLLELVAVAPDAVGSHVAELLPGIQAALQDSSSTGSNSKVQALQFLNSAMASNNPATFQPSAERLSKSVYAAVGERYYKVAAEALRVCEQLVRVIRPDVAAPVPEAMQGLVRPLYDVVMARLSAQDQDQEVKECAISCMAAAVASLGDALGADVAQVLRVLLDRLKNEVTRLAAVKALATIARSPLNIDLSSVLAPALAELTTFLRKANRQLRQAALTALEAIVRKDGSRVDPAVLQSALEEAASLVNEGDLLVTALSLGFATTALREQPACADTVVDKVLPQALALVKSPLLQGAALEALQAFFQALVGSGARATSAESLLEQLRAAGTEAEASKSAQHAAAQCYAVLSAAAGQSDVNATVQRLIGVLQDPKQDDNTKRFALLCVGELGRRADVTAFPALPDVLTSALNQELIAESASTALGGVAAGNLGAYLPLLLQHVHAQANSPKQLYQLLKALNEVITSIAHGATAAGSAGAMSEAQQAEVLQLLLGAAGETEEECRAVVAECLGSLALLNGQLVLPALRSNLASPSAEARTTVVSAVRHTLVDAPHGVDQLLPAALPDFLARIGDEDRHVRRAAVQVLSTAAHNKPGLVVDHLPAALPLLYQQTIVNKDLIRTVDLGPFKHQIDDGLELRKAAYECMDELLDRCYDRVDAAAFIQHLESGLRDHYDVKTLCHPILSKLAAMAPGQVTSSLDRLVEPLQATLQAKVKADAVKQEIDRNEDMLRSCLRAVDALAKMPNAQQVAPFKQFLDGVVMGALLKDKYLAIREERRELESSSSEAMESMAPFQGGESGSDNSESEPERSSPAEQRRSGADQDDDDEELEDTDDEQDRKEIEAALIIQDLKTEDEKEDGGFARRRVQRGSVVVVRGSDGDGDDEATWVALVNKVYREKSGALRVGVTWFNRKSDIPAKEARRVKLAGDGARQLLFSNAEDSIEAKYIRHPAVAWFLPAGAAPPRMRCGAGDTRHERVRPGFLVQHAYDSENERVYNIGAPELRRECPDLAKEVDRLVEQSREELARLQREEEQFDAKHGTQGQLKPLALQVEAEQQASESESESDASSSSSESESEDEGRLAAQAAALASKAAAAADAKRRRQEEAAERAAAAEAQKQRQMQEAVDAEALRLAQALPQQAQQAEQQQQQDQQGQQQQQPEAEHQQDQQGAVGPAGAAGDSAQQAVTSPASATGNWKLETGNWKLETRNWKLETGNWKLATVNWRRYGQQLQKHAGRLPWRTAPAPSKPGAGGAGPASAAPKLSAEQAAAREAAEVQTLLQGCCTPSPKPLATLLRAVCGCTQAAAQGLFTEQVQLFFGRVLLTWLWHLVSLQLPDLQEAAKADPAAAEAAAEVAGCIELLLQALERQKYTPAYDKWLGLAQGHKLISALARNMQGAYPPGVQQAATQLKELWSARAFKMREHLRQRQRQKEQEQKREAAKEKADAQLLQRSPLASKAAALATSGLRATALGAGGDAMLAQVKQKVQKRPAAEMIDLTEAAEQRAAKVARTAAKPQAPPGSGNHAGGSKGHNKLAALVKKAQRQGGR